MHRVLKPLVGVFFLLNFLGVMAQEIDRMKDHTLYLASDKLGGRGAGSKGIHLAASYIAQQFRAIGLEPLHTENYYDYFSFPDQEVLEKNVIGIIPANTETNASIVFTAHYDGYGTRPEPGKQDDIYNGARDNAVGVAALIELARRYSLKNSPDVNLVFIATAAEEFGQYGIEHYLQNPVFPLDELIINLNIDGFNVSGSRADYFIMPRQGVDFIDEIAFVALRKGWIYNSPDWIDSMNTNFDTASFLKRGIPAFTLWTGDQMKQGDEAKQIEFGAIHSPEDEVTDLWDWSGTGDHLDLYMAISDYFIGYSGTIKVTNPELFLSSTE